MSDVYSGSFLNIAATSSSDSQGGPYHERNPLQVTPFRAKLSFALNHWKKRPFAFFPRTNRYGHLHHTPLAKPAWVVQERLLVPRTVHFLRHKVVWECTDLTASESDTEGVIDRSKGHWIQSWAVLGQKVLRELGHDIACLNRWTNAVRLYSRGQLSCESDKLIAISV